MSHRPFIRLDYLQKGGMMMMYRMMGKGKGKGKGYYY